jgi:hypothetical protein
MSRITDYSCNYSGQIYAEPHKSYENVKHARASPISEADF